MRTSIWTGLRRTDRISQFSFETRGDSALGVGFAPWASGSRGQGAGARRGRTARVGVGGRAMRPGLAKTPIDVL